MASGRTGRQLRLLHLANHDSNNIGNGALILGLERVLREDFGPRVTFTPEPWDAYTVADSRRFDDQFIGRVNVHDALLVGGAVMMNGMRRYVHTGTRLDFSLSTWGRITKPLVFYGVATSYGPRQRFYHLDRLKRFMEERVLGSENVLFSVRNDGTKQWLESVIGYASDQIVEVPDPAFYVPTTDSAHLELHPTRPNVVLSLNAEGQVYRFGGRWPDKYWRYTFLWRQRRRQFLRRLAAALDRVASSHDVNIILCPHCPTDHGMIAGLLAECSTRVSAYSVVSAGVPRASQARGFYDLYRKADLAVSMRIHSLTCAVGLGTPAIGVAGARRMPHTMRDAGLADFVIRDLEEDLADMLYTKMTWILENSSAVRERVRTAATAMRERTAHFNERVGDILEERCG